MRKNIIAVILVSSFSIVGCNNSDYTNSTELEKVTVKPVKKIINKDIVMLPTYGPSSLADGPILSLQARNEGSLTIKDGCVSLTYPKEHYPTASGNNTVIPIFPGGSKIVENGQAVQVGPNIFREGEFIEMSGSSTIREFWKSMGPDMEYTPVPDHCIGSEYWMVGSVKKIDANKAGK